MAKIAYKSWRLEPTTQLVVNRCEAIIVDFASQGYDLTLRQLYYQMIGHDLFPSDWIDVAYNLKNGLDPQTKNTEKNYKKLGDIINRARWAGMIDWDRIEDRRRNLMGLPTYDKVDDIIAETAERFHFDVWEDQYDRVELFVEKEAQAGVVGRIANRHRVNYLCCVGYVSASELFNAGRRIKYNARQFGQTTIILYIGDHDPSGLNMDEDIANRLSYFCPDCFEIKRVALTYPQVEEYNPPPNPAKITDSRAKAYIEQYGENSWELDALSPAQLSSIVDDAIAPHKDEELFNKALAREKVERDRLIKIRDNWDLIGDYAEKLE